MHSVPLELERLRVQHRPASGKRENGADHAFVRDTAGRRAVCADLGQQFDEAVRLARKGIELAPASEYAPLGHYVIADVYSRQGHRAEAEQEAALGRALERKPTKAEGRTRH